MPAPTAAALTTLKDRIGQMLVRDGVTLVDLPIGEAIRSVLAETIPLRDATVGYCADGSGVLLAASVEVEGIQADARATFVPDGDAIACRLFLGFTEASAWAKNDSRFPFDVRVNAVELAASARTDFALTLWAEIDGGSDQPIPLTLELPGADGQWTFHTDAGGAPVTLPRIMELLHFPEFGQSFPWVFDAIGIAEMAISFTPGGQISLASCAFASTRTDGGFPLVGDLRIENVLARVEVRDPLADRAIDLSLAGLFAFGTEHILLEAQRTWDASTTGAAGWTFAGTISDIEVSDLFERLGLGALPPAFPDRLVFRNLRFSATPALHMFELQGSVECQWTPFGEASGPVRATLAVERLVCSFDGDSRAFDVALRLHAQFPDDAPLAVGGCLAIRDVTFTFALKSSGSQAREWQVGATLTLDVLEAKKRVLAGTLGLTATGVRRLSLSEHGSPSDGALGVTIGPGTLALDAFAFWIETTESNGSWFVSDIGVDGTGRLIAGDLAIHGTLHLERKKADRDETPRYELRIIQKITGHSTIAIPVPPLLTQRSPAMQLQEWDLGIAHSAEGWSVTGGLGVALIDFPPAVTSDATRGSITLDPNGCVLTVSKLLKPVTVPLVIDRGNGEAPLDLGTFSGDATNLTLTVAKDHVDLSADLSLALPEHLNRLFCWDEASEPPDIFALGPDNPFVLRVGLGTSGATLQVIRLPIRWLRQTDGQVNLKLGDAGTIRFAMPTLEFGAGTFSVDLDVSEDPGDRLRVPLTAVKRLLSVRRHEADGSADESRAAQLCHAIADVLPDSIPLQRPQLFDEKNGLRVAELLEHLESVAGQLAQDPAWPELKAAIEKLAHAAEGVRLPDRFIEYLDAGRPSALKLKLSANASGSVDVRFAVDPPVYLLIPQPWPPQILGLKISSFTFGEILSGALFLVRIDAQFDVFDLPALAACIAASKEPWLNQLLPELHRTRKTLYLDDLTMFIIYQTSVPIPIPVFYDRLGFEYRGLEGLALGASIRFNPLADNDIASVFQTAGDMRRFLTDPNFALPADGTSGISVKFSLRQTFLHTPPYLGDRQWGEEGDADLWSVDFAQIGATILNTAKFFSIRDVLTRIALEHRCGSLRLTLGPVDGSVGWLATTAEELRRGLPDPASSQAIDKQSHDLIAVARRDPSALLAVFQPPESGGGDIRWPDAIDEQGLLFMLQGMVDFSGWFGISTTVGVATSGDHGMATFALLESHAGKGKAFGAGLCFRLSCLVSVDFERELGRGAAVFAVAGGYSFKNQPILVGSGIISDQLVELKGHLSLFDAVSDHIAVTSDATAHLSRDGLLISASAAIRLWGMTGADGSFKLTQDGFSAHGAGTLGGSQISVTVSGVAPDPATLGSLTISGELRLDTLQHGTVAAVGQAIRARVDGLAGKIAAERAYDQKQWPWKKKYPLRTDAQWGALYACAVALESAVDGTISATARYMLGTALSYLPAAIAGPVQWLQQSGSRLDGLVSVSGDVTVGGTLALAQGGKAELRLKHVRFMGNAIPDVALMVSMEPAKLVQAIATALARRLVKA